jgi:hypothetical protein
MPFYRGYLFSQFSVHRRKEFSILLPFIFVFIFISLAMPNRCILIDHLTKSGILRKFVDQFSFKNIFHSQPSRLKTIHNIDSITANNSEPLLSVHFGVGLERLLNI